MREEGREQHATPTGPEGQYEIEHDTSKSSLDTSATALLAAPALVTRVRIRVTANFVLRIAFCVCGFVAMASFSSTALPPT